MAAEEGRKAALRQAGFTLLEVLIAFVIAALALGVLVRGASTGLVATGTALRYEEALSRARSRLAATDARNAPMAGDQEGDDGGGYRWRVRISPLATAAGEFGAAAPMLFSVSVVVSWQNEGRQRSVRLDTRRLGTAPPPPP